MNNFKQMLQSRGWRMDGVLWAHIMMWFGDSHSHRMTRYKSSDAHIISKQLDIAQAVGVDGFIVTYQGSVNPFLETATLELFMQLSARGMRGMLLADPWLMNNKPSGEQLVINELTSAAGQALLTSPCYDPKMRFLDFTNNLFNEAIVQTAMQKQFPNFQVLKRHVGYSWPEIQNTKTILQADNANPAMQIPGLYWKFFDGGNPSTSPNFANPARGDAAALDMNTQDWDAANAGTNDCRLIESQAGNTFFDCLSVTPLNCQDLALVTWNDYEERTDHEAMFSMMTGIQLQ